MNTERFLLRNYQPGDFAIDCPVCVSAWEGIFQGFREQLGEEVYRHFYTNWQTVKYREFGQFLKHNAQKGLGFTIVDTTDNSVAAMGSCRVDNGIGTVVSNACRPDLRGMGLGSALHRRMLEAFRQEGVLYAQVCTGADEAHASARRAYERAGFGFPLATRSYFRKNQRESDFDKTGFRLFTAADGEAVHRMVTEVWQSIRDYASEQLGVQFLHFLDVAEKSKHGWVDEILQTAEHYHIVGMYVGSRLAGVGAWHVCEQETGSYGMIDLFMVSKEWERKQEWNLHCYMQQDMVEKGVPFARYTVGPYEFLLSDPEVCLQAGFDRYLPSINYHVFL